VVVGKPRIVAVNTGLQYWPSIPGQNTGSKHRPWPLQPPWARQGLWRKPQTLSVAILPAEPFQRAVSVIPSL